MKVAWEKYGILSRFLFQFIVWAGTSSDNRGTVFVTVYAPGLDPANIYIGV